MNLKRSRPNIILIIADSQGFGDLGCHGNPVLMTPNLDKLHDQSVSFSDFHVSTTSSPTRSAFMTGKHEFKSGITHTMMQRERMALSQKTVADLLRSVGYKTGIFGKWHLGDEQAYQPQNRGFDEVLVHGGSAIGQSHSGTSGDVPDNHHFDPLLLHDGIFKKYSGFSTDVLFNEALGWIGTLKNRQPFFAVIAPDAPYAKVAPDRYKSLYRNLVPRRFEAFCGMLTNLDDNVGRLLDYLKSTNISEHTVVVYTTDNGSSYGAAIWNAEMRGHETTPFYGGTRGIAFWHWPGAFSPRIEQKLTAHVDLLPTFASLAGVKIASKEQDDLDGYDLLPLLTDQVVEWPDRVLFTHIGRWGPGAAKAHKYAGCSIRWQHYNLVCTDSCNDPCCTICNLLAGGCLFCQDPRNHQLDGRDWQLFDLNVDPGEYCDIGPAHREIVHRLSGLYDVWWEGMQARLINEQASQGNYPKHPFHELYRNQFNLSKPKDVNFVLQSYALVNCAADWRIKETGTPFNLLCYVFSGTGHVKFESHAEHLEKGKLYLFPASKPYEIYTDSTEPLRLMNFRLAITPPIINNLIKCHVQEPSDLWSLISLVKSAVLGYDKKLIIKLLDAVLMLVDRRNRLIYTDDRLSDVIEYIHAHYAENLGNNYLAGIAKLSLSALIRLFNKVYNMSPQKYIVAIRMENSCELLAQGTPVYLVAHQVGYSDAKAFSRAFKRYKGVAPTEYH